jgi:hypothetical protein
MGKSKLFNFNPLIPLLAMEKNKLFGFNPLYHRAGWVGHFLNSNKQV